MEIIKIIIIIVIVWGIVWGIWKFSTTEMNSVEIEIQKIYMWLSSRTDPASNEIRDLKRSWNRRTKKHDKKVGSELNSVYCKFLQKYGEL